MNGVAKHKPIQYRQQHHYKQKVSNAMPADQVKYNSKSDTGPEPPFFKEFFFWFFKLFAFWLHKAYRKHGVKNKSYDQGCRERKDKHCRQVDHKLTYDALPE